MKNNFKILEEEIIAARNPGNSAYIKNSIVQAKGVFRFIGDMVELFIPKMIESIVGGRRKDPRDS